MEEAARMQAELEEELRLAAGLPYGAFSDTLYQKRYRATSARLLAASSMLGTEVSRVARSVVIQRRWRRRAEDREVRAANLFQAHTLSTRGLNADGIDDRRYAWRRKSGRRGSRRGGSLSPS